MTVDLVFRVLLFACGVIAFACGAAIAEELRWGGWIHDERVGIVLASLVTFPAGAFAFWLALFGPVAQ